MTLRPLKNPAFNLTSIISEIGKYLEYVRVSFMVMLAYRVNFAIGIVTYIIHVAVYYYLYQALYMREISINGYGLHEILTYVSLGWIAKSLYLNYIDREIATDVESGHLAMEMIKPVDFQMMYFARGFGQTCYRLFLFTPPIILVTAVMFSWKGPASGGHLILFLISTFMSVLIYLGINYIVGVFSVIFLSLRGVIYAKNLIIELLSGLLAPIDWFPGWFQTMSAWLPFQYIAYNPLKIYLGHWDHLKTAQALGAQCLWTVILLLLGRGVWHICRRRILIQGG
jgi:ABC-2 type transport system permease protein